MKQIFKAIVPAALFTGAILLIDQYATASNVIPAGISEQLPVGFKLNDWYGIKTQESEAERRGLAADTKFSKAIFRQDYVSYDEKELPPVTVSIVFSGSDMNNSIHRPEWCLPSQGHIDLTPSTRTVKTQTGKEYTFTRLSSYTKREDTSFKLNHIHYFFFVSPSRCTHSHNKRNLYDIIDRLTHASIPSWAYLQVGSHWAPEINISEEECDAHIQKLLSQLLPEIMLNGL